ncbi:hypothetical protein K3495_g5172 [Podosphaera aphanis]|nr:hypothetical protein K3495_g5172 [Podosphaera aphanis]
MDLASLKEAATNLTLYDIKAGVRKFQNAVMNYTEMEAKVREATNNEPWGASSSMMQEIANGTYNYQLLNEIMPMIYKRFTEKAADEWRQIYKALQLLEFLIKNGSERVIDDARTHITLLKMLRQFHFIDQNGKDQGLNVRNRAKELAELLSDVERIRAERKKARASKSKYTGVEGGANMSSWTRHNGFGNEESGFGSGSYGGYSGGVYGDGGGFGGQQSEFTDSNGRRTSTAGGRDQYEEYDEFNEGATAPSSKKPKDPSPSAPSRRKISERGSKKPESAKKKQPEVDLFSFDDTEPTSLPTIAPKSSDTPDDEEDFDDFQCAAPSVQGAGSSFPVSMSTGLTTQATHVTPSQPVSAQDLTSFSDLASFNSIPPAPTSNPIKVNYSAFSPPVITQQQNPTAFQSSQPNYFTSVKVPDNNSVHVSSPSIGNSQTKTTSNPTSGNDVFGSLWSSASAGIKKTSTPASGPALQQLAKEKASAGIWGNSSSTTKSTLAPQKPISNGLDDLLG